MRNTLILGGLISIALCQLAQAQDPGLKFYSEVLKVAQACASGKSGTEQILCYTKATPNKCESEIRQMIASDGNDRSTAMKSWQICVASCADASIWSSEFGECSREIE